MLAIAFLVMLVPLAESRRPSSYNFEEFSEMPDYRLREINAGCVDENSKLGCQSTGDYKECLLEIRRLERLRDEVCVTSYLTRDTPQYNYVSCYNDVWKDESLPAKLQAYCHSTVMYDPDGDYKSNRGVPVHSVSKKPVLLAGRYCAKLYNYFAWRKMHEETKHIKGYITQSVTAQTCADFDTGIPGPSPQNTYVYEQGGSYLSSRPTTAVTLTVGFLLSLFM
ncbi:MAG: hypothetical protein MHM6MM_004459 [Cercozoa sp. M6MM]